jgi:FkbM family methyltransferase
MRNMPPFTDKIIAAGSTVTRNIPYFCGLGSVCRRINKQILKFNPSPIVKAKMKDGTIIIVDLRTDTEMPAYWLGKYDDDFIKIICSIFNHDSIFLDVGANIGFYTVAIGAHIRSRNGFGKVISFEPFEGNFTRLIENIEVNSLDDLCKPYKFGLSDTSHDSLITLREDFSKGSGTGNAAIPTNDKFDQGFKTAIIKLERLDDFWKNSSFNYSEIDFIKVDIEGHEDFFLRGGAETIAACRPTILLEVNKPYYRARGVGLDSTFLCLITESYLILRRKYKNKCDYEKIHSLDQCRELDNVFLVPKEKIGNAKFKNAFGNL